MYCFWEWSVRFAFLLCILLTGLLFFLLTKRVLNMTRRKRETQILNELEHIVATENGSEQRNQAILKTLMQVFSAFHIDDACILQPDVTGALPVQSGLSQIIEQPLLSVDEKDIASWVLTCGYDVSLYESFPHIRSTHSHMTHRAIIPASMTESTTGHYVRFLPLKVGIKTVAVLRLSIRNDAPFFPYQDILDVQNSQDRQNRRATFFWKYLGQIATYIERVPVAEPVADRKEITLS